MKTYKLGLILTSGLAIIFLGCGSSSSGGGSSKAELTPQTAESMAITAAAALPGCVYQSDNVLASPYNNSIVRLYTQTVKDITTQNKTVKRAETLNETQAGTCPTNPGSLTITGEHDNGDTEATYSFNQFCSGDSYENTVANGGFTLKSNGTPSDSGPIIENMEVKSGDISVKETSSEGVFTHTVKASKIKYTFGNPGGEATSSAPNVLTIDSFSAVDGKSGEKFAVSNAQIKTYPSGESSIVQIDGITYTDPENGTVTVSTTSPIVVGEDGEASGGNILVEGSGGSSMIMRPDSSVQNGFTVETQGEQVGVVDCSGLGS